MTRALGLLLVLALLAAGGYGLRGLFNSRDSAGVDTRESAGPGAIEPDRGADHGSAAPARSAGDPPTSGTHRVVAVTRDAARLSDDALLHAIELGNVALVYPTRRPPAALREIQTSAAGPFDAGVAAAGQAVLLVYDPKATGVQALAWRHRLRVDSPRDPALRAFAEAWLGRGADAG